MNGMRVLGTWGAAIVLVAAACAPAAAPSPTAAPAKPAESKPAATSPAAAKPAESKPAATSPAAAKPAESKPAAAQPAAKSDAKPASKAPTTLAEIATYRGADREQVLYEGAKREATLTWYTSLAGGVVQELARGFEEKYPGIKVQEFRANTDEVITRLAEEYKTRRYNADVLEINQDGYKILDEQKLLIPYWTPHLANFVEGAKEPAPGTEGLVKWVVDRQSFIGFGYNTNLIPANAVPKTWQELGKPELKGKLVMSGAGTTGARVFGTIKQVAGEDFIRNQLWPQNYTIQEVSGRALLDLVVSGEAPSSPTIFRNHALEAKAKGAPVDWVPLEPVPTNGGSTGIPNQSAHPFAATLWVDFILGPTGQGILEKYQYGSAAKTYGFNAMYPEVGQTAREYDQNLRDWGKLMRDGARKS